MNKILIHHVHDNGLELVYDTTIQYNIMMMKVNDIISLSSRPQADSQRRAILASPTAADGIELLLMLTLMSRNKSEKGIKKKTFVGESSLHSFTLFFTIFKFDTNEGVII